MAQSPELIAKLAVYRQKIAEGSMSTEDYRQCVLDIRGDRKNAAVASEQSKRVKAKAVVPDAKNLLAALMGGQK